MTRDAPGTKEGESGTRVAVSEVSAPDGDLQVGVRRSIAIKPVIFPANATDQTLSWSSDNLKVAIVDANGIVTGIGNGTAQINGVSNDGGFKVSKSVAVVDVAPTRVRILYGNAATFVGSTHRLFAYVDPWLATNKEVTWKSTNSQIATVDKDGVVTGVGPGSTTVTVITEDGGHKASVTISVSTLHVKELTISPEFAVVPIGDSIDVKATWTPANASNRTAKWSSADTSIATIDANGKVTALRAGKTKITAAATDGGFTDSTVIEVSRADAEPFFVEAEKFGATGGTFQGFKITEDQRHTNYNQTGDWADYKVQFLEKGTYQILLDAGTPLDGAGVEILIDGTSAGSTPLPNTGNWGKMQRTIVSNRLSVPKAGNYTIRVLSVGKPNAWQWNADKLGFRKLTTNVYGNAEQ